MRLLKYFLRFAVLTAVLVGPLAWFGYRTLSDDVRELHTEQRRAAALRYTAALRDWAEQLEHHRSASLGLLAGDATAAAPLAVSLDRIDATLADLDALDHQLGPTLGTTASWHEIAEGWDDLRAGHVGLKSPTDSDDAHNRLLARVTTLVRHLSDTAQMSGAEKDRAALYDNVTVQRFAELDALGQARALAAVAGQRSLTPAERSRLQGLRGTYQAARGRGQLNLQTAFDNNASLDGDLETFAVVDTVAGDGFFDLLDREVLAADAPPSLNAFPAGHRPAETCLKSFDGELKAAALLTNQQIYQARRALTLHGLLFLAALVLGLAVIGFLARTSVPARPRAEEAPHERYIAALGTVQLGTPSSPSMSNSSSGILAPHLQLGASQIRQNAAEVSVQASQARVLAERLAQAADVQAQLAAGAERGIEHLSASLKELADRSTDAVAAGRHGVTVARAGLQAVRGTLRQLNQSRELLQGTANQVRPLAEGTRDLARAGALLDDVSEWTTLLALNAGVQAANGGPEGERLSLVAGYAERLASRALSATREVSRLENMPQEITKALSGLDESSRRLAETTLVAAQASQALAELEEMTARLPDGLSPGIVSAQDEVRGTVDVLQCLKDLGLALRSSAEESRRLAGTLAQLAQIGERIRGSVPGYDPSSNGASSGSHLEDEIAPGLDSRPSMIHGEMPVTPN